MKKSIGFALFAALSLTLVSGQVAIAKSKPSTGPAAVALYYSGSKDGLKYFLFTDPNSPTSMKECNALLKSVTAQYKNKAAQLSGFKGLRFVRSACVLLSQFKR